MIHDLLDKLWVNTETQASVTTGTGLVYFMTQINWIGVLTALLLLGQLGLLIPKYWKIFKDWKAKRGGQK